MTGVYVVCLDPDITGIDNVVWCFTDEYDADAVVAVLVAVHGPGSAWHTYEPVARSRSARTGTSSPRSGSWKRLS